MTATAGIEAVEFRRVLGEFCTGITVITTMHGGEPVGFTCQSFSALSLEPPLVLFCPSVRSRAWAAIESSGRFCVNVLGQDQREVSQRFGSPGEDKFRDIAWSASPLGSPVIAEATTWIDCTVTQVHTAGDHHIVIGAVAHLASATSRRPLLFHRGAYTTTERLHRVATTHTPDLPMTAEAWF